MARPLRLEYFGAVYHVMARGNQDRAIFRDDRDRQRFLETLAGAKTGWQIQPKGAPEKTVLAWWFRARTTVTLRWIGQRLRMGHYTRVTQAVSRMQRQPARKLEKMKRCLLKLNETPAGKITNVIFLG